MELIIFLIVLVALSGWGQDEHRRRAQGIV